MERQYSEDHSSWRHSILGDSRISTRIRWTYSSSGRSKSLAVIQQEGYEIYSSEIGLERGLEGRASILAGGTPATAARVSSVFIFVRLATL